MPGRMRAVYYRDQDGQEPVNQYIDQLPPNIQGGIDWNISLLNALNETDPPLEYPHTSQVDGELREPRCKVGGYQYRILFRRSKNLFVLLHIFQKNSEKVPKSEVEIARSRWDDFRRRMDVTPHVPPRAGGHGAT